MNASQNLELNQLEIYFDRNSFSGAVFPEHSRVDHESYGDFLMHESENAYLSYTVLKSSVNVYSSILVVFSQKPSEVIDFFIPSLDVIRYKDIHVVGCGSIQPEHSSIVLSEEYQNLELKLNLYHIER